MKRSLWLCLCSVSLLTVTACGDDDPTGGAGDGGVDGGAQTVDNRIDELDDEVARLRGDLDGLNGRTDDLEDKVDDLGDLPGRVEDLETPDTASCSTSSSQSCTPDGVMIVSEDIDAIIERLCAMEFNCCDDNELRYKFGIGVTDVADCKATFKELVARGFSPDFLETNGDVVDYVIDIAHALNNRAVKLEIDEEALKACLDSLEQRECPKFAEGNPDPIDVCDLEFGLAEMPCDPRVIVKGRQQENEPCGLTFVPECDADEGLVCRKTAEVCVPGAAGCMGHCAPSAEAGDRCTSDAECDSSITELYCDRRDNTCKERADEGEDCAYVNLFSTLNPGVDATYLQNPVAMAIECKRGLTCDPKEGVCVPRCSEGSLCAAFGGGGVGGGVIPSVALWNECPDGNTCNVTENPGLRALGYGVCRPALQEDEPCTPSPSSTQQYHECESDRCALDVGYVCFPALLKVGEACTVAEAGIGQEDATCVTGFCAANSTTTTAGKCAERCNWQSECPDTHFCDTTKLLSALPGQGSYPCDLRRAEDQPCNGINEVELSSGNQGDNYRCASGHCDSITDPSVPVCKPKQDANSACSYHPSCPVGQYCNNGTCADTAGPGEDCANPTLPCDYGTNLVCATVGSAMNKCHAVGEFPNGATCAITYYIDNVPYYSDALCASGWCAGSTCAEPVEEGEECDVMTVNKSRCADGLYCNHPPDDSVGTCDPKLYVGEPCSPYFGGQDCVGGACTLRADEYVCGIGSVEEETVFCDGE